MDTGEEEEELYNVKFFDQVSSLNWDKKIMMDSIVIFKIIKVQHSQWSSVQW